MAQIRKSQEASHTDGTVAIEYGLILPALLLFTLGIMDTGRLLWTYITLTRATETAARCGAVANTNSTNCTSSASIQSYAAAQAWGINDVTAAMFTVTTPTCGEQVQVTYTFQFITPWFPSFSASAPFGATTMTLNATACYPIQ